MTSRGQRPLLPDQKTSGAPTRAWPHFLVLRSPEAWRARFGADARRATLSVGNFDGLHLGHQKILQEVATRARSTGTLAAVVTFDPHPLKVLRPETAPPLVQTLDQRLAGLAACGLDAALVLRFDRAFAALPAEGFVRDILVDLLRTETILVGKNFRFGHRQQGDIALLAALGRECGFAVEIVPPVVVAGGGAGSDEGLAGRDEIVVSSTAIRRAVLEGRVQDAARLLGKPFVLTGTIETGSGRGSTILFPTLNLRAEQELLPKPGVYATEVRVDVRVEDDAHAAAGSAATSGHAASDYAASAAAGEPAAGSPSASASAPAGAGGLAAAAAGAPPPGGELYGAATNVGFRPTFNGTQLSIESHLFGFSRRLTSGRLEVRFRERLRDEIKFSGPDELRRQIAADLDRARALLAAAAAPLEP